MIELFEQFRPHHEELRIRLLRCCKALLLTSIIAYLFKDFIANWCTQPVYTAYPALGKLVYTSLPEAFVSYIKLAVLSGCIVSSPFLLYQIWMFVSPGLLEQEKQTVRRIVCWAGGLFAGGACFSFFILLPRILVYFMSYASPTLVPKLKLGFYLGFVGRMVLAFGIAFEIPFLMVMAVRSGLLPREHFVRKRLWFYAAIVVLAFMLAAGEFVATLLLSLPLFALYEAGILAARIFTKKNNSSPSSSQPPAP